MDESGAERKLTAILCTDVVGYSRLMGDDHEGTLATLEAYRKVFSDQITAHKGRVVNAPGDSILAEFGSVVDAVSCAVEVQRELAERNLELPNHRRMDFRIGVNLGDVLVKDTELYGDGVNVAARLESLAEPGGICISGNVHDQVKNRLPLHFQSLGHQRVKNITEPVATYKVLTKPGDAAHRVALAKRVLTGRWRRNLLAAALLLILSGGVWYGYQQWSLSTSIAALRKEAAFPLPGKPSIAVVPFTNLGGDPSQEYISNGISETITTWLTRNPDLVIIAPQSSANYRDGKASAQNIGRELGVRYVLQGSVQKSGERIRITARLIDAANGKHLWAESFDRELNDIFTIQDRIAREVLSKMEVNLKSVVGVRHGIIDFTNAEAYFLYLKARNLWFKFDKAANAESRTLVQQALDLEPKNAVMIASLGITHWADARFRWAGNPSRSLQQAKELALQALAIDGTHPFGHMVLAHVLLLEGTMDQALAAAQRVVELAPGDATAQQILASFLVYADRPQEALEPSNKALRLNPNLPPNFLLQAARVNYFNGRYEEAVRYCREALQRVQEGRVRMSSWLLIIASNMKLGREDEARTEAVEFLKAHPTFSAEKRRKYWLAYPWKNPSWVDDYIMVLRKAGLPE